MFVEQNAHRNVGDNVLLIFCGKVKLFISLSINLNYKLTGKKIWKRAVSPPIVDHRTCINNIFNMIDETTSSLFSL